jgi:hypothetical protein
MKLYKPYFLILTFILNVGSLPLRPIYTGI